MLGFVNNIYDFKKLINGNTAVVSIELTECANLTINGAIMCSYTGSISDPTEDYRSNTRSYIRELIYLTAILMQDNWEEEFGSNNNHTDLIEFDFELEKPEAKYSEYRQNKGLIRSLYYLPTSYTVEEKSCNCIKKEWLIRPLTEMEENKAFKKYGEKECGRWCI